MTKNESVKVCFAVSECVPFVKTGGLADVAGALPVDLSQLGCKVKLFLPLYSSIDVSEHQLIRAEGLSGVPVHIGHKQVTFDVWYGHLPNSSVEVYFIDCPQYYHRSYPYTQDWDEDERFSLLQHGIIQILQRYHWAPDVIHCNDWQTSLLPVFLKYNYNWDRLFDDTVCLLSIHNIAYQGLFSRDAVYRAGLPYELFYPGGPFELYGSFCFLKAGILFSDLITTVSETYAQEIQSPAYGARLDGVLASRKNDLFGVLNGVDTQNWNPRRDQRIPFLYGIKDITNKKKNKQALLQHCGMPFDDKVAVIGIVSRLTYQKGFELLHPIIHEIMKLPVQIVALGNGDQRDENFFRWAAQSFTDKFAAYIGFNDKLAHLITAGADMLLMPSRYEPCGLNQMYGLTYGTVPIVRKTGGLADTVKDYHEYHGEGNGFSFYDYTHEALYLTIRRALDIYQDKNAWHEIMKRGMRDDFSWKNSAKKYLELYQKAISRHKLHR